MALRARCPVPAAVRRAGLGPGGRRLSGRGREGRGRRCPSARHAPPAAAAAAPAGRARGGRQHICLSRDTRGCAPPPLSQRSPSPGPKLGNGWDSQNPTPYKSSIESNDFCLQLRAERQPVVERPGERAEARSPGAPRPVGNCSGSEQGEGCWHKVKEPRSYLNGNDW